MFGSLAVNARAGLGSPYPRPLQAGDELQTAAASGAAERRIDLPAINGRADPRRDGTAGRRIRRRPKRLFLDSEWKISATSDRMGYRLEGPVIKHLHGHNIVSDGTVNGSIQVPGNGAADRADAGPRHQRRLSQDRHRDFGRSRAVRADTRPARLSASRPSAWPKRRPKRENRRNCCAPCPTGCDRSKTLISTSKRCKMPMSPAPRSAPSMPGHGKCHQPRMLGTGLAAHTTKIHSRKRTHHHDTSI